MWHWWCLFRLKMIVLLNNKREEIDRAVFYCVSQNVNLVEIKHFSYWQKKVTQSPPWGNPPVPPWSHLFHVHENVSLLPHLPFWNCFVILCSNFIYFTRPSNSSDSVISLTDSLWQNSFQPTVLSKSSENSDTTFWLDDVFYSPDKGTDPDAAVGCLETYCYIV